MEIWHMYYLRIQRTTLCVSSWDRTHQAFFEQISTEVGETIVLPKTMSIGEQDEIVKRWWQEQLKQWDGIVVDWDPDDNRNGLNNSVELFIARHIKPDVLIPRPVSRFTQRQLESIFDALPNIDDFLRRILP